MNTITSNKLRENGILAIENNLKDQHELLITEQGEGKFVVMDIQQYNYFRECELDKALYENKINLEKNEFITETISQHMKRITE